MVIKDVNAIDNYIACDGITNSEIVVPIFTTDGRLVGVFDLDSPLVGGFDDDDKEGLEALAKLLGERSEWPVL